jgi:tetratricopeptide (TPR) repeat protein
VGLAIEPWKLQLPRLLDPKVTSLTVAAAFVPDADSSRGEVALVDLLELGRDRDTTGASWLARLLRASTDTLVILDHPSVFVPVDELLTREVLAALGHHYRQVFLWLDVSAYGAAELPRIMRTFFEIFPHAELSSSLSMYAGPYLCLRGSQAELVTSSARDLDQWRLLATGGEMAPQLAGAASYSLAGVRLAGRVPSPLGNPSLPEPEVLRELATTLPPSMNGVAELWIGLAHHAVANPAASPAGVDTIEIPAEELRAYGKAAECEPLSRLLATHFVAVCELLLTKHEYEPLRDFADALSKLNPADARYLFYLGKIGSDLRDPELALIPLEKALELDPTSVRVLETLATVRGDLGDWEKAIELLERERTLEPMHKNIVKRLGIAHLRAGHAASARELLEEASRLSPDDPEVAKALAELK